MTVFRVQPKSLLAKLTLVFSIGAVCIGGAVAITVLGRSGAPTVDIEQVAIVEGATRRHLRQEQADKVGRALVGWIVHDDPDRSDPVLDLPPEPGAVFVGARQNGALLTAVWRSGDSTEEALVKAARDTRRALGRRVADVTTLQVDLAYDFQPQNPEIDPLGETRGGLVGIELIHGDHIARHSPTEMIAANLSYRDVLEAFAESQGLDPQAIDVDTVRVRTFAADQFLVDLTSRPPKTTLMYRGNIPIPIDAISRERVEELERALAGWLFRSLQSDGRMVYSYLPSLGAEKPNANNMIRQWMATVAMIRVAKARGDPSLIERAVRNIEYNLEHFYEDDGAYGLIDERGRVKLGGVALAALALVEHPERARWSAYERKLLNTVNTLWWEHGSFDTFYRPRSETRGENYYPGEALLLLATLYQENRDPALLERFMTSMRHYREWHLRNRNPAFVPWHTQAYFKVWEITKDPELAAWIFEMNDWLLSIQQWDRVREFPDLMGRFYDPDRPFGPPHAASTGVYLEGLIDAWRLATAVGDEQRAESYRRAIMRGLRSTMQLAFLDEVDMFYVAQRDAVRGGVRATPYDNVIRVDNVQHNLLAILKILEHMPATAFRPGER